MPTGAFHGRDERLESRLWDDQPDGADARHLEPAFIPWFALANSELNAPCGPLDELSNEFGATPSQLALAWFLKRSP